MTQGVIIKQLFIVILNVLVDCDFGFQEHLDVYFKYKVAHFPTNALQQIALQLRIDRGQYQGICKSVKSLEGLKENLKNGSTKASKCLFTSLELFDNHA